MIRLFGRREPDSVALLTKAVALVYGAPLPSLCRTPAGKPYFPDRPDWHFSLSHSGPYALCALSNFPVGADIERVRPSRAGFPEWVLSAEELAVWDGTQESFLERWTEREAVGKYLGTGLQLPPRAYVRPPELQVRHYRGDGLVASVCGREAPPEGIEWV